MDKLIAAFPSNIIEALEIASKVKYSLPNKQIESIVICGMGGSGIGGKLVSQWLQDELTIPVVVVQDYMLPGFTNEHTLLIASSYSGETEETLNCVYKAFDLGAHIIGICSGGKLASFCSDKNLDFVIVPGGNPPRTALAFSLGQLLSIFVQFGFVSDTVIEEFRQSASLLVKEDASLRIEARELAQFLKDKFILMYSASNYEAVAIRARQQFNENGKILCSHHTIPEMNHNELVGWGLGDDRYGALFFDSCDWFDRNKKRLEFSRDVISTKTKHIYTLQAKGNNVIERSLYFIHCVDWASFYLSELNNVDATEIDVINKLKGELSHF